MEQKKIEQITLHLIVFGTIIIISVLARQTVLHYGWDEFSSYLILITRVRDKDCVKNRVKRAKIVRFTLC